MLGGSVQAKENSSSKRTDEYPGVVLLQYTNRGAELIHNHSWQRA